MIDLTNDEIDAIFRGIYTGKITPESLPRNLYAAIAEKLKEGLYKGYGGSLKSVESSYGYGSAPADLLKNLRENIYLFAGAKTFHQTEEMRGLLVENGKVVTYDVFSKRAKETYDRYNEHWMQAEYVTAVGQAESARKWVSIEEDKHLFPFLRYIAVMDANTSTICAPLNDITLPVDDPFWDKFSPLNHYRCRCVREQLEKDDATVSSPGHVKKATDKVYPEIGEGFNMNPGKTGEVFGKGHPYFKEAPEKYKDLAKDNFNLPIPKPTPQFKPAILDEWGLDLDDDVFKMLNKEMKVFDSGSDKAYATQGNIHLDKDSTRWKASKLYKERLVYHETGHVIHSQRGLIQAGVGASEKYTTHFKKLKKLLTAPEQVDNDLRKIIITTYRGTKEEQEALMLKFGAETNMDVREMAGSAADSLMSLSNTKYGQGHDPAYFKIKGTKEAEMFAHSMENKFLGNPVFKEVMPEIYEESIKYIETLEIE